MPDTHGRSNRPYQPSGRPSCTVALKRSARPLFIVAGFIVMLASIAMLPGAGSSAARAAQQVLVTLIVLAVYLQYDVLIYARIAALFPALKGL